MSGIEIAGRRVGVDSPPYVIAEMSANHHNDLQRALAIVDAAADAGADALKLQTYTADSITIDCGRPDFLIADGPWSGTSLHSLYTEASTPWDWHEALFARARDRGLHVFSSAFDRDAVDFLVDLGVPAFKVASFELVDLPLIEHVARTGRPIILSTGMATRDEIADAVEAARRAGCEMLALLYCISGYPTPVEEANLASIPDMRRRFGVEVGLSDHTLSLGVASAAVTLGASIIEKHLTLDRSDGGPDAGFSLHPDEFRIMTQACRDAREAIGTVTGSPKPSELPSLRFRRSLYAVADIEVGEAFDESNVRSIRPSGGLAPKHLHDVLGRRAARAVTRGEPMSWDMVDTGGSEPSDTTSVTRSTRP